MASCFGAFGEEQKLLIQNLAAPLSYYYRSTFDPDECFFLYLFTFAPERSSPSWIHLLLLISGGGVEALRNSVCGTKIKSNVSKDGAASLEITLLSVCCVAE